MRVGGDEQGIYPREDVFETVTDVVVCDAQNAEAIVGDTGIALAVVVTPLVVDGAVDLDDETSTMAVEVHDEARDDLLAAEGVALVAHEAQLPHKMRSSSVMLWRISRARRTFVGSTPRWRVG
jgi:hypothetical protein